MYAEKHFPSFRGVAYVSVLLILLGFTLSSLDIPYVSAEAEIVNFNFSINKISIKAYTAEDVWPGDKADIRVRVWINDEYASPPTKD